MSGITLDLLLNICQHLEIPLEHLTVERLLEYLETGTVGSCGDRGTDFDCDRQPSHVTKCCQDLSMVGTEQLRNVKFS